MSLRQLRRALRRADGCRPPRDFTDLLVEALDSETDDLAAELGRPLRRLRAVLAAARRSAADGGDPRYTLWQAWHRSGLQRRWLAASERGGLAGAQADRDLDAVTALFDVAEQYVTRTAGASLRGVIDHVEAMGLPATPRDQRPEPDAVAVVSAHAALGREWEFVVIAGLQEGLWPNTIPRGGVLGTQQLVDVMDGVATEVDRGLSSRAPLLAEERRLLIAAMGRARRRLLVTAVDSDNGDESMLPSPFCYELAALATEPDSEPAPPIHAPRVLAAPAVVGRLRAVVCTASDAVDETVRACAATQLARLATAGVAGADPAQWYGMTPLSCDEPLWDGDDHVVTLSPSTLQMLTDCPLRWLLERHGGTDGRDVRSAVGSLLHALVAESGKTESQMLNELEKLWSKLPFDSQWYSDNELARHRAMLSTFAQWRAQTRSELTEMGTEIDVDGTISPGVRVRGRLDRLERDSAGRLVVVDIKTGKTPVSKDDAQRHAQLAMYQLAVAEGLLPQGDTPGGGRLVYRRQDRGGRRHRARAGRTDGGCTCGVAGTGPASGGRHQGPGVRRADQRRLCALPGAGHVPGPDRRRAVMTPRYSPAELASALGLFAPTEEQAAVIAAPPGPLVVIAGAGAGKTETMAARVVWLVANGYARPGEVLGLTFTRKAAGQLLRRVRTRLARLAGAGLGPGGGAHGRRSRHRQHLPRVRREPTA